MQKEVVDHITTEEQESEGRDEERAHVEAEEQLKCRREEWSQPGEINKTKLTSTQRPKPTDSDLSKNSGKLDEEEEKSAEEAKNQLEEINKTKGKEKLAEAKNQPGEINKTKGGEKLANEQMKVNKASTPPAQRVSTPPAQRASTPLAQRMSTSTQRAFAKLNEGPAYASMFRPSPFYLHQAFYPDESGHDMDGNFVSSASVLRSTSVIRGLPTSRMFQTSPFFRTRHALPRPDYFDGGAKSIVHCLNFDTCKVGGKSTAGFAL